MTNEVYKHHLAKYIEWIKGVEFPHPITFLKDKNALLQNIEDIEIAFLYPHHVYTIENHHNFRKKYEHLKHGDNAKEEHYIFVINDDDLVYKIQDFIKRSFNGTIHEINTKDFLNQIQQGLNWHERINDYHGKDIEKIFEQLLMYRKLIPKKNINREETDLIVLSSIYDMDATKITDSADCYIYYQNILDVYGTNKPLDTGIDMQHLIVQVFKYYHAEVIGELIEKELFDLFDKAIWISLVLKQFNQLTEGNLRKVLKDDYLMLKNIDVSQLVKLAERVERKDKKIYLQKRDLAEEIIRKSNLSLYQSTDNYVIFIKENQDSPASIVTGVKNVLKEFNLEGAKRLYKYSFDDLREVLQIVSDIRYQISSVKSIKIFLSSLIDWLDKIYDLEKNSYKLINSISNYNQWIQIITERLYNLEYELSEIRYSLDTESLIESSRYEALELRLNSILNEFRKSFAQFIETHYSNWIEHGSEQPILNHSISKYVPVESEKTVFIIFDGMRYDAWKNVVKPYFKPLLEDREVSYNYSLAMLPSTTSLSREAIYKDIRSRFGSEINYITKSESESRQQDVKDSFLMTKRINILIFNMFDKEGHTSTQGLSVFYNRQKEVFEASIKELIRTLPKDAHLVIASDHGFSKINKYIKIDDAEQVKARYIISSNAVPESIQIGKYKLAYSDKGYYHGGGERDLYSHGGASFEEIVLPFIHIKPEKTGRKVPVSTIRENGFKLRIEDKEFNLSVNLNKKEKEILQTLSRTNQLTTSDIEGLLINRFGEAGMVDGMMKRLGRKLDRSGEIGLDIRSAGEIIVYKLIY